MDKEELIERFDELNTDGCMLKKAFTLLVDASEKSANEFLECYEGVNAYNNFVSECEAMDIVKKFKNSDGSMGAKWMPDALFNKVTSLGGTIDKEPFYNKWSLYVAMNMEHSDHEKVLLKWSEGDADKYAEACYDFAVSQLQDTDRPQWIREYFHLQ